MKKISTLSALILAMSLIPMNVADVSAANYNCTNSCVASVSKKSSDSALSQPFIAKVECVSDKANNTFVLYWTDTGAVGYEIIVSDSYDGKPLKTYDISSPRSASLDVEIPVHKEKRVNNDDGTYYYQSEIVAYNTYRDTPCKFVEITLPDGLNFIWVRPYVKSKGRKVYGKKSDFYLLECWSKSSETDEFIVPDLNSEDYYSPDNTDDNAETTNDNSSITFQQEVLDIVNAERAKVSASPLTLDPDLCRAAQIRAVEISGYFSHTRPDGRDCFTIFDDLGIPRAWLGENIAAGMNSSESVMSAWMNSSGHRANILSEHYCKLGVGYNEKTRSWVQIFSS